MDHKMEKKKQVILVVGSCGLDRLLTVAQYPIADAKVRTTGYNEVGGGNAANTASTMGFLKDATFLKEQNISVKFVSKVGDDSVGQQLINELEESNVETLFCKGPPRSNTAFTTIIVSEKEHTRTCIHTPGSCGEISESDLSTFNMDEVFENVVHLHSDSRNTVACLFFAREARARGIKVSCDCEKDRKTAALDELIQIADILFTNSSHLGPYLDRLDLDLEEVNSRQSLPKVSVVADSLNEYTSYIDLYAKSLAPSAFFMRWYSQFEKEVIVTQGHVGSLHYKPDANQSNEPSSKATSNEILISENGGFLGIQHRLRERIGHEEITRVAKYIVHQAGVVDNVQVVDTTGAGDAFIGGYLMAILAPEVKNPVQFALQFGSWVAGRKLEGPGARSALPKGADVDLSLGIEPRIIEDKLKTIISHFGRS